MPVIAGLEYLDTWMGHLEGLPGSVGLLGWAARLDTVIHKSDLFLDLELYPPLRRNHRPRTLPIRNLGNVIT